MSQNLKVRSYDLGVKIKKTLILKLYNLKKIRNL